MGFRISLSSLSVVVLAATLTISSLGTASAGLRPIAVSGDIAPGTTDRFVSFEEPVVNANGDIAFVAKLDTGDFNTNIGIWKWNNGILKLVIRGGDSVPTASFPIPIRFFSNLVMNNSGDLAFRGITSLFGQGIWKTISGNLEPVVFELIAQQAEIAPGTSDPFELRGTSFFQNPVLNARGDVAFRARVVSGDFRTNNGLWFKQHGGSVELVARAGDPAPGTGANFDFITQSLPSLADSGEIAFGATIKGISFPSDMAIWRRSLGATPSLVMRDGDPTNEVGEVFDGLRQVLVNAAGDLVFKAIVTKDGTTNGSLWRIRSGGPLEAIVRSGDSISPDSPFIFTAFSVLTLNGSGNVDFVGSLDNSDPFANSGIFRETVDDLEFMAGEADLPPFNTAPPQEPSDGGGLGKFFSNDLGDVAGTKVLREANTENMGIYVIRNTGSLFALSGGDLLAVAQGDIRSISELTIAGFGLQVAGLTPLSQSGQFAFRAGFDSPFSEGVFLISSDNISPQVSDDVYTTLENTPLDVSVVAGVVSNDSDADGDPLIAILLQGPTHGTLSLNPDGSFIYTPNPNFNGIDSFTYLVSDGLETSGVATALINITPVNDPPVAVAGADRVKACTSAGGTQVTLDGSGSSDAGGDPLTYNWTGPFPEGGGTVTSVAPTVTLPVGTSTVTLIVNDGVVDSAADTVDVAVTVQVDGLRTPLAALVPSGDPVVFPHRAFEQGKSLPLKLKMFCGGQLLTETEVAPPVIADLVRVGGKPVDLGNIDPDRGRTSDNGLGFRFSVGNWNYNLNTKDLIVGTYELAIEMHGGQQHVAGFMLK